MAYLLHMDRGGTDECRNRRLPLRRSLCLIVSQRIPVKYWLEEFLKPLHMSVNALAKALRVPATRIGAVVKGERSITA